MQGAGCRVQGAECSVQVAGCRVQGAGCRVQGAGLDRGDGGQLLEGEVELEELPGCRRVA